MYLEIKGLDFSFHDQSVLKDASFQMDKGDIVALLGPSGSGKSTFLRILSGLAKCQEGQILIHEEDITFLPPEKRNVGMVFQDYALFPHMNVKDNILFGIEHLPREDMYKKLHEMLQLTNLVDKCNKYPHQLSGGEKQRVALARSLAQNPDLLLLDEPFSNLDTELKAGIREELKTIFRTLNTTCLFVTHDIEDAMAIADSVYTIQDYKIKKVKNVYR